MSPGNSLTHCSMGVCASTVISSFPLGSRRTFPGDAGPSGITSISRCTPSASVTSKIASIAFMVPAWSIAVPSDRSTNAALGSAGLDLPPRLLFHGDTVSPPLARQAFLWLAGNHDLLGSRRQRGGFHEVEVSRDLVMKVDHGQETGHVEADHQGAVPEWRGVRTGSPCP